MARGDVIGRLVAKLGGSPHPDQDKPGGCHFKLWGGEIRLYGADDGKRHWFRKGPKLFVVRRNFIDLLATAIELGVGKAANHPLQATLSLGPWSPFRYGGLGAIQAAEPNGFWLGATTYATDWGHTNFGYWDKGECPVAWNLVLGFLTHGEWRPLVDHLLETDPGFGGKWAAFEAARKETT